MASGNGYIVRIKPAFGRVTRAQLGKIAQLADQFGNGVIELTNRILRGVERELNQDGYVTRRYAASYITPILHAIRLQDGKLDGGADPAGDGMAASC